MFIFCIIERVDLYRINSPLSIDFGNISFAGKDDLAIFSDKIELVLPVLSFGDYKFSHSVRFSG